MRAFALAPGIVRTRLSVEAGVGVEVPLNTAALPAATALYLTSGRADWLSGRLLHYARLIDRGGSRVARYYSSNWDIAEVERDWKEAILEQKGLVNELSIPKL